MAVGCSSGASADAVAEVLRGVERDQSSWSLPSDLYTRPEVGLEYAAQDLLIRDCLRERGIEGPPVRAYNADAPRPATSNEVGRRLFDGGIAVRFGYSEEVDPRIDWGTYQALQESDFWNDPQNDEAYLECVDVASQYEGVGFSEATGGEFAVSDFMEAHEIQEAAQRWRECMAPLGVADLSDPYAFPTVELLSRWGYQADTAPWIQAAPSEDEIRVAEFDAACRESSGWAETVYEAAWEAEEEYLAKHFNELEALRAKYGEQRETYLRIIEEYS